MSPQIQALDMQGYQINSLGAATASADAVRYDQLTAGVPSGTIQMGFWATAPSGWLLLQGGTIGSASSGGTVRANADTETLYAYLWDNLADAQAAVSTGRGASAAADFAANKTITLPNMRQRFPIGLASAGTGSTIGGTGGTVDHTHTAPAHYHGMGTGADLNITSSGGGSQTGNESAGHTHFMVTNNEANATLSASNQLAIQETNEGTPDHYYLLKGNSGSATLGLTGGNNTNHTHTAPAHTHASGDHAGRIGLVTGGVDGNAAMTSGTGNPPFLAVNFIIRL